MSWPVEYFASSMPETIQYWFCQPCQSHGCICSGCTGKMSLLFFQDVLVILCKWAQISSANVAVQESQLWDCYQSAFLWSVEWSWIEIVQCTKVKLRSCRWLPVFPSGFSFVLGKILLFWLLIWHFMASGIFFQFDARNHTVLVLPALPIARVHLFRLYWQDVITVLPRCACHFVQMGPDLFSKCGCARITTLGLLPVSILWNGPE